MSDPQTPLVSVNLAGDLGTPANTLVERIADAVGGTFKPMQMRRIARAEAQVALIKAKGDIELQSLQQRTFDRFAVEEMQKQVNMEAIAYKALPHLNEAAAPENMGRDWITHYLDRSRLISDEDAQVTWARLLAGEANEPGKYSKRTIDVLASLDQADAELFTRLCSFVVDLGSLSSVGGYLVPIIYDMRDNIYRSYGLNFDSLTHLDTLGLINTSLSLHNFGEDQTNRSGILFYFTEQVYVELTSAGQMFDLGGVLFTEVGKQLQSLVEVSPVDEFVIYLKAKLVDLGYKTTEGE